MYYLNKYNYETKINECIYYDTLINVKQRQKEEAYKFAYKMNGQKTNQSFKKLFYKFSDYPLKDKHVDVGEFYITISDDESNVLYVNRCEKMRKGSYGILSRYLLTLYDIKKYRKFTISKSNKQVMVNFWSEKFQCKAEYTKVLENLKKIYNENNIYVDSDYKSIKNEDDI